MGNALPHAALLALLLGCSSDSDDPPPSPGPLEFVFCSDRDGNFELYRSVGGVETALTDDPLYDSWWPRVSPGDGMLLFYRSLVADRPPSGGFNNNYDAASLWQLPPGSSVPVERIPKDSGDWLAQGVADWSPDGTQLVMAARSSALGGRWHLWITAADGSNPVRNSQRTSLYLDPSWSPDGARICCVAYPPDYDGLDLARLEVYTMLSDGSDEQRLTSDAVRDQDPYWSPDGAEIAFETEVDPTFLGVGRWALRAVPAAGGAVRVVLDDGNINTLPRWSSDATTLFFQRFSFGAPEEFRLARVPAAGGAVQFLTAGGTEFDDTDIEFGYAGATLPSIEPPPVDVLRIEVDADGHARVDRLRIQGLLVPRARRGNRGAFGG